MTDEKPYLMLKVGIKYCGGCNPDYDRVAFVKHLEKSLGGRIEFVSPENDDVDLVLAIEGCKTACADLSSFEIKKVRIIAQSEDANDFIQELLSRIRPKRKIFTHKVE